MKKLNRKQLIKIFIVIGCIAAIYANPYSCSKRITNAVDRGELAGFEKTVQRNIWGVNFPYHMTNFHLLYEGTNYCPLHYACKAGNVHMVKILLRNGADPNVIGRTVNRTPLISALKSGREDRFKIAHLLMDYGADITYKDEHGDPPLLSSLITPRGDSEQTKTEGFRLFKRMLEAYGIEEAKKEPILQEAATFNNRLAVDYILDNNIQDINYISAEGRTPLMGTAFTGKADMCRYLLEKGADKSIRDNEGKTAYDYAVHYDFKDVAELCRE